VPTKPLSTAAPSAAWIFLPALGAPLAHAPVLRWNLIPALRRPINRRLFGENKTWRGALVMTGGTVVATLALHRLPSYTRRLPQPVAQTNPALLGALLGGACWLGELPNSFFKRRFGIAPGERRASPAGVVISIFDQADWVPLAALLLRPIWKLSAHETGDVFALVAATHVPINLVGYAVGARTAPL
jgi:CDP-diacylglycerol--serine O-phosphatidyltransferase